MSNLTIQTIDYVLDVSIVKNKESMVSLLLLWMYFAASIGLKPYYKREFMGDISLWIYRSSRPEVVCKKCVLRNFAKFTGKHLCQSLFFNKVAGGLHRCFPVNFAKSLRTPLFTEHLRWLLLNLEKFLGRIIFSNTYERLLLV